MVSESKPKSSKSRSRKGGSSSAGGGAPEKLKTVIRRLPPNLPEEIFWQSVQPWVTEETASWKQFHQGKMRKRYVIWYLRCCLTRKRAWASPDITRRTFHHEHTSRSRTQNSWPPSVKPMTDICFVIKRATNRGQSSNLRRIRRCRRRKRRRT